MLEPFHHGLGGSNASLLLMGIAFLFPGWSQCRTLRRFVVLQCFRTNAIIWWGRQNGNRRFIILIFLWTIWRWRNDIIFRDLQLPLAFYIDYIMSCPCGTHYMESNEDIFPFLYMYMHKHYLPDMLHFSTMFRIFCYSYDYMTICHYAYSFVQ